MRDLCLALAAALALGSCSKQAAESTESAPADPRADLEQSLQAYERIRAHLAADAIAEATTEAAALARHAAGAESAAAAELRPHLGEIASAATRLKDLAPDDADAVRHAFGEVSRHLVALLYAEPTLTAGRHIFECPMSQGYSKWVQTSEELSNPYMGTKMLACGGKSQWTPGE